MDHGLFGPDSITWRVHADPTYAIGGLRGLLLQALHPLAMAAVEQNGGFHADPWGRLTRTSEYIATITFAPEREALRAAARVRGIHRKLRGRNPFTGDEFRLDRPDLLLWVHCSEVDSLLSVARRGGLDLTDDEADAYLREQVRSAELVGLAAPDVPSSRAELADYFVRVRPELRLTAAARRGARGVVRPPMPGWVQVLTPARPAWGGLAALSMGLLPGWARRMYRLPDLGLTDLAATGALRALRAGALAVPERFRAGPTLKAAKARLSA
ncbi:Uncharacterized conserved protein, DUF2236 family [Nakamurella panacisegetis]|uniref:Uncharacterized conserved protein, DUF2236 family n=1 Tax=Nakamurella panacisegetis TaxID=1090615 RepID=A0A1H0N2V2_9ACTN|nr:oxygenase MpaB family protein [Nakamurella panacisegetis]SDO86983.1 Uncharacterized conserved protein, DUF2236 family [Nakamurella panacisegetis]